MTSTATHQATKPLTRQDLAFDKQQVCIELPGEAIRCVIHKPKLEVVLRKHRDVVIEIHLFKGMSYTLESDGSDFYNARDKRIVFASKKEKVDFKDGERLHLWVGRTFKGGLVLKAAGKILGRYEPNRMDPVRYDEAPGTKPAPLIVVLKNEADAQPGLFGSATAGGVGTCGPDDTDLSAWTLKPVASAYGLNDFLASSRVASSTSVAEQHATIAVVDAEKRGMPQKLLDFFSNGGGKSGLADLDTNDVATRNWLLGQFAGATAYAGDNWNWLRHSIDRQATGVFRLVNAKVAYLHGKVRIYFAGYSARNPVFGPGGHGPGNPKILQIYSGIGSAGSAFTATAKAVAGTFKGNALISFLFGSATSWAEWKADLQKDKYDLVAALLTTLVKAVLAAAITAIAVALILLVAIVVAKVAVAALAIGALTVTIGFAANYVIEAADKKLGKRLMGPTNSDGTAAAIAPWLRNAGQWLAEAWGYLEQKLPKDYRTQAASP